MALSVPAPTLTQPDVAGTDLSPDKPITVACHPVTFEDGTPLGFDNRAEAVFGLYRELGPGAVQGWDEEGKSWVAEDAAAPQPLMFEKEDGSWRFLLIATGQEDADGQSKFASNPMSGFPRYFVRCSFRGLDASQGEHAGESPPSEAVRIPAVPPPGEERAIVDFDPKPAASATSIRMVLKDAALVERGRVEIREQAGAFVVELTAGGARAAVTSGGEIVLEPAAGQSVRVEGHLAVSGELRVQGYEMNVP